MSWFVDLAGRAEDFLNKVDQGAASALTKHSSHSSSSASFEPPEPDLTQYSAPYETRHSYTGHETQSFISAAAENIKKSKATVLAGTANVNSTTPLSSAVSSSSSGAVKASSNFVRPKRSEVDDDLLFDFLNSSDPPQSDRKEVRRDTAIRMTSVAEGPAQGQATVPSAPATPPSTRALSRTSSLGSLTASTHSAKTENDSPRDGSQGTTLVNCDTPESSDSGLAAAAPDVQAVVEPSSAQEEQLSQVVSGLRLENQLLRSEVSSLNQEMASLVQRAKDTQEELNQARSRAEKWNAEQSRSDRAVRELRSQVDDLTQALTAKDAQLAVLRVRLDEADQLLKARSSALEDAQSERTRILQDHSEGNSLHSQALQTLQERLREAETALNREQDSYRQMQSEFATRLARTEAERQTLAESLMGAERRATEERQRAEELQQQAKTARAAADYAKQELQEYKNKASRILQSKEKLISSLKEGSALEALDAGGTAEVELEELRHEKELQKEEIQKLQAQIQSLRSEIQELENQALVEAESWREQQLELQEQNSQQSRQKQEVEAELERCKQELHYVEEEHHRTKSTLQSRIKDREDEIQKLRNQLTNKALSSSSQAELEGRLHQLTETLIQKQTMLEALGTEKSSLVFQLERLEQQLKSVQGGQSGGSHINMAAVDGPGARQRNTPVLFSDQDGSETGVYGKVRKAASTIDRFSIRLGIFLRRYPMARVFVIVYMALLHLWVMIVLLTYTPEMHSQSHPDGR
ncbi:golgin subfamily A member 5 isoform X1 [Pangasianodon hypophthalmus]|uniref:golgin subfamily A member 5 isoform X1 n=1 Tax=Pangasianodon hypophthalmus TaxID=310915 RepID=UPI002306FDBC|nr:golgin subfamily A member 5 isoform X1 [Pangasianodon hypophthalmus]